MKLPLFQQMVELNLSFDQVAAGLQRLQTVPFFQRDLIRHALSDVEIARVYANREFFDNFEKIVEDDPKWAYRFQRKFNESGRIETTSTSKLEPQKSDGSSKDSRRGSLSCPIGICPTRTATTKRRLSEGSRLR